MAARKKSNSIKNNPINAGKNIVILLVLLLIIDGFIRLFFSSSMYYVFPGVYLNTDLFFHIRWFGIGLLELIFAWGILKFRLWALYGFLALTVMRFYTIVVFPPKGFLIPLTSNCVTYFMKIAAAIILLYIFFRRKKLKFS